MKHSLLSISPVDGRYRDYVSNLDTLFSEYALFKYRILIEICWLELLASNAEIVEGFHFSEEMHTNLENLVINFDIDQALRVKEIERKTNHDVKSVEYYIKEKLAEFSDLQVLQEWVHFGCTSEDINNLSYALILKDAKTSVILPQLDELLKMLSEFALQHASLPMLSRTHGQPASPTTVGKEFANFEFRLFKQRDLFSSVQLLGKMNGAVGNYNAHTIAFPAIEWPKVCENFVESLGLTTNPLTTQIEPHDCIAEYFQALSRINTILIDLSRDIWGYISLGYFSQRKIDSEVGSSTMPHKINPIDFENAEGNLGIANALASHFASKLPISRWQRDLSDSTVFRSFGVAVAHSIIGYTSIIKGLKKLEINKNKIKSDLEDSPEVLAEAIQTVMRRYQIFDAYDKLKEITRGQKITIQSLRDFVCQLDIPKEHKDLLTALTPDSYIGKAEELVKTRYVK